MKGFKLLLLPVYVFISPLLLTGIVLGMLWAALSCGFVIGREMADDI